MHTESYCTDPDSHAARYDAGAGTSSAASGEELTEERRSERRAERATVIANNRAWNFATTHRREWLGEFLGRKKAPADAVTFIAATLAGGSHDLRRAMENGHPSTCALLGLPEPGPYYSRGPGPLVDAASAAGGTRATLISLAVVLGAFEDGTSRNSWRSPSAETIAYFTALREWRYPLRDVEQLVLDSGHEIGPAGLSLEPGRPLISVAEDRTQTA